MAPPDDRKVIKIEPGVYDELIDVQHARRKHDGRKTSISDLIAELLHQAKPAAAPSPPNTLPMPPPPQVGQERHELLHLILTQGTEREQLGIQSNLEAFAGVIRGRKGKKRAAG